MTSSFLAFPYSSSFSHPRRRLLAGALPLRTRLRVPLSVAIVFVTETKLIARAFGRDIFECRDNGSALFFAISPRWVWKGRLLLSFDARPRTQGPRMGGLGVLFDSNIQLADSEGGPKSSAFSDSRKLRGWGCPEQCCEGAWREEAASRMDGISAGLDSQPAQRPPTCASNCRPQRSPPCPVHIFIGFAVPPSLSWVRNVVSVSIRTAERSTRHWSPLLPLCLDDKIRHIVKYTSHLFKYLPGSSAFHLLTKHSNKPMCIHGGGVQARRHCPHGVTSSLSVPLATRACGPTRPVLEYPARSACLLAQLARLGCLHPFLGLHHPTRAIQSCHQGDLPLIPLRSRLFMCSPLLLRHEPKIFFIRCCCVAKGGDSSTIAVSS